MSERSAEADGELGPVLVRRTPTYVLARSVAWLACKLLWRLRVSGLEHLPRTGGLLIAANHASFLDIPVIGGAVPRHVAFVARDSLLRSRFVAWLIRGCGAVTVRRGTADRRALREILAHLEAGDCVAIFPEGTRSPDGRLGEFRAGALSAARRAGVPVLPAAVVGSHAVWPRGRRAPRLGGRLALRLGRPVPPDAPDALERVRAAVAGLLEEDPVDRAPDDIVGAAPGDPARDSGAPRSPSR